jgi:hypothetical protein
MKESLLSIALVLAFVPAISAQSAKKTTDVSGQWTGTMTRTAPDGRSQTIAFMFELKQSGKVLTGTAGPSVERQWAIEKGGTVDGSRVTFRVQQPEGPMRTFTLQLVKDRLQGEMLAELNGQSFTTKVDAGKAAPAAKTK